MKNAFLIGAYINPEYVDSLISSLRSQRSNVYIHVNKSYFNKLIFNPQDKLKELCKYFM